MLLPKAITTSCSVDCTSIVVLVAEDEKAELHNAGGLNKEEQCKPSGDTRERDFDE
jgi:hypothetical protein